jgi:hypothetical protein
MPGAALPDFTLPDDTVTMRRLSELQGDDAMILMPGRGTSTARAGGSTSARCWCSTSGAAWPLPNSSPACPNDLYDTRKMRISPGARWPYLADADLEVHRAFEIEEYDTVAGPRKWRHAIYRKTKYRLTKKRPTYRLTE